jgi:Ribosomal protein L10
LRFQLSVSAGSFVNFHITIWNKEVLELSKKPQMIEKEEQVSQLQNWLQENAAIVLADYRGLTVSEDTALRSELRKNEIGYHVAKNTLIKRAANNLEITDLDEYLNGPTALAFAADPVALTKILSKFAEEHTALELKAGLVDGKFVGAEEIKALAKMPSREVLLGRFMGSIQSSLYSFVRAVDAIKTKKENGEPLTAEAPAEAAADAPAAE